jgi:hypothetical protein
MGFNSGLKRLMSLNAVEREIFFFTLLMTSPTLCLVVDIKIEIAVEAKHSETLPLVYLELKYFPCLLRLPTSLATSYSFSFSEDTGSLDSRCFVWYSEGADSQISRSIVWCSEVAGA